MFLCNLVYILFIAAHFSSCLILFFGLFMFSDYGDKMTAENVCLK